MTEPSQDFVRKVMDAINILRVYADENGYVSAQPGRRNGHPWPLPQPKPQPLTRHRHGHLDLPAAQLFLHLREGHHISMAGYGFETITATHKALHSHQEHEWPSAAPSAGSGSPDGAALNADGGHGEPPPGRDAAPEAASGTAETSRTSPDRSRVRPPGEDSPPAG